jgi:hypothetical protein
MRQTWILVVIAGLAMSVGRAGAASVALGVNAGLSVFHLAFDRPENLPLPEDRYDSAVGLRGGVYASFAVASRVAVLTGLTYESSGGRVEVDDATAIIERVEYATIPLLLEVSSSAGSMRPIARIGLECGLRLDADAITTVNGHRRGGSADVDEQYSSVEGTLSFGGGVRVLKRWDALVGYRHGLTNNNGTANRAEHPIHHRSIVLGVTYWFLREDP